MRPVGCCSSSCVVMGDDPAEPADVAGSWYREVVESVELDDADVDDECCGDDDVIIVVAL